MLENIEIIISLGGTCLTLLLTTILFLKKTIKNKKVREIVKKVESLTNQIIPYIKEAEGYSNYSGVEKKSYVMTKLQAYALENKIAFNKEEISNKIESLIELTNEVNVEKKIKEKTILNEINEELVTNTISQNEEVVELNDSNEKLKKIIEGLRNGI